MFRMHACFFDCPCVHHKQTSSSASPKIDATTGFLAVLGRCRPYLVPVLPICIFPKLLIAWENWYAPLLSVGQLPAAERVGHVQFVWRVFFFFNHVRTKIQNIGAWHLLLSTQVLTRCRERPLLWLTPPVLMRPARWVRMRITKIALLMALCRTMDGVGVCAGVDVVECTCTPVGVHVHVHVHVRVRVWVTCVCALCLLYRAARERNRPTIDACKLSVLSFTLFG